MSHHFHLLSVEVVLQSVNLRTNRTFRKIEHIKHTHTENMATYSSSLLASYTLITKATAYTFSAVAWANQQHPEQMKNEKSRPPPFLSSKLCSSKQQRAAQTKSIPKDGINPNKTISKMPRIRT